MKPREIARATWAASMAALFLLTAADRAAAQAPAPFDGLPFQGFLSDANGAALGKAAPANYDIIFRIYDAPSGGTLLWTEQQTVTVDSGHFSVELGMGGTLDGQPRPALPSLFRSPSASERHVETVLKGVGPGGSDHVIQPRVRLYPLPYAFVSSHALTAGSLLAGTDAAALSIVGTRVGVNTTDPQATLDVQGTVAATDAEFAGDLEVTGTVSADSWNGGGTVPVGTVILWSGSSVPSDWALCDGTVSNGVQTPDLRGRFVMGAGKGPGLAERRVGDRGGSEASILTAEELPPHNHSIAPRPFQFSEPGGEHRHGYLSEVKTTKFDNTDFMAFIRQGYVGRDVGTHRASKVGSHPHVLDVPPSNTIAEGGGEAHPHTPPFHALAYIIRVR